MQPSCKISLMSETSFYKGNGTEELSKHLAYRDKDCFIQLQVYVCCYFDYLGSGCWLVKNRFTCLSVWIFGFCEASSHASAWVSRRLDFSDRLLGHAGFAHLIIQGRNAPHRWQNFQSIYNIGLKNPQQPPPNNPTPKTGGLHSCLERLEPERSWTTSY